MGEECREEDENGRKKLKKRFSFFQGVVVAKILVIVTFQEYITKATTYYSIRLPFFESFWTWFMKRVEKGEREANSLLADPLRV